MNDAMKFIYRITSGGANHGVIESFSGRNSYWLLLFYSEDLFGTTQQSCMIQKIIVSEQELEGEYTM